MYLSLEAVARENNIDFLEVVSKALNSKIPVFFELRYPDKRMTQIGFIKDWLLYGMKFKLKEHDLYAGQYQIEKDEDNFQKYVLNEGMFSIVKGRGGIGNTSLSDDGLLVLLDLIESVIDGNIYSISLCTLKMKDAIPPPLLGIDPKLLSIDENDEDKLKNILGIYELSATERIVDGDDEPTTTNHVGRKRPERYVKSTAKNIKYITRFGYKAIDLYKKNKGYYPFADELWEFILGGTCVFDGYDKDIKGGHNDKNVEIIGPNNVSSVWDFDAFKSFYYRVFLEQQKK